MPLPPTVLACLAEGADAESIEEDFASWIGEVGDERLVVFGGLKKAKKLPNGAIVAEGTETVRNLLSSNFTIGELLLTPLAFRELRTALKTRRNSQESATGPTAVFLCDPSVMETATAVPATRLPAEAALALVQRSAQQTLASLPRRDEPTAPLRVLALDGLTDAANVGALVRLAVAFGVDALCCSAGCCDPFNIRAVRASGGQVFLIPIIRGDLAAIVSDLREHGALVAAAVVQDGAKFLEDVPRKSLPQRWALIVGSEHAGVSEAVRQNSDLLVKIRMAPGVDSLNVGISAGVLLHGLLEREVPPS